MAKIWKYELEVKPKQMLYMPKGPRPLSIRVTGGIPYMYVEVNPGGAQKMQMFRTVCAGEEFNSDGLEFVDSFAIDDWFVGHVYHILYEDPGATTVRFAEDFTRLQTEIHTKKMELALVS